MGRAACRVPRTGFACALAVLACAAAAAPAPAATLNSGPLVVETGSGGELYATLGDRYLFATTGGLGVYLADGPLAGRAFAAWSYGHEGFTPLSQEAPVRVGDITSQRMVYGVQRDGTDQVRVTQTTRVRAGTSAIRMTYEIRNTGAQPLRFRASVAGELTSQGSGVYRAGTRRFVGLEDAQTGLEAGLDQVTASRLPGDTADVAVPSWSGYRAGYWYSVYSAPAQAGGLGTGIEPGGGVGAEWSDHMTTALRSGETARYEVLWHFRAAPPLSLRADRPSRYVGATSVVTAVTGTEAGEPAAGQVLRWRVAGANERPDAAERSGADGTAALSYSGATPGSDVVSAYVDLDDDGIRDAGEPQDSVQVEWATPPPRISTSRWGEEQVGRASAWEVLARDALGEPAPGAIVRWNLDGRNATAVPGRTGTDSYGYAQFEVVPRYEGPDVLTIWIDEDDDGVRDGAEPAKAVQLEWAPPPPPLRISVYEQARTAGEQAYLSAYYHDEFGIPHANVPVRWSVAGVSAVPERVQTTSYSGESNFVYTAPRGGSDVVTAYVDLDNDGARDDGEPQDSVTLRWQQAPPAEPTITALDGTRMDVSVSDRGSVDATFRDEAGGVHRVVGCSTCNGLVLRFTGGALDGLSYSNSGFGQEPFYGDAQGPVTRAGDTLTQVSSYRVRRDDIDYVRVHQTTTYTEGEPRFRTTYRLENLTAAPLQVRAGAVTPLYVGGDYRGPAIRFDTPRRMVGGQDPDSGVSAGLEEVAQAPWAASDTGYHGDLAGALGRLDGLDGVPPAWEDNYGAAVQWAPVALPSGDGPEYALDWRVEKPPPLHVTPLSAVAETRHTHRVTATAVDDFDRPRNGVALRWNVTGANPSDGILTSVTAGLGQAVIAWTGANVGRDTLHVHEDTNGDGVIDPGEPQRTVVVDWRQETAVDPPVFDPLTAPNGSTVQVGLQGSGDQRFIGLTPGQAAQFPTCADGSPKVGLGLRVNVDPGAGHVVAGSMTLRTIDASHPDLEQPVESIPPAGEAVENTYRFVIECLRPVTLYLCYTLEEAGLPAEEFCVLLGGLGLYDPSGVVYDRRVYDAEIAKGRSAETARAAAAILGAEVRLQRRHAGVFRQVLSGDPFVTPNVNPYLTGRNGRFGWSVSPGTYRVVVSARGYATATSRAVTVPPPEFALNVALVPEGYDPAPVATPSATPDPTATPAETAAPLPELPDIPARAAPPAPAAPPASPRPRSTTAPTAVIASTRLDRRGRLRLVLRCPAGPSPCSGRYRVKAGTRTLGTVRFAVAAGRRATHTLRLDRRGQAAVKASRGRVRISAVS